MTTREAEKELYYIVKGKAGGFMKKLFETITLADTYNQTKLSAAFPEFVETVRRYQVEPGYWESIERKILGIDKEYPKEYDKEPARFCKLKKEHEDGIHTTAIYRIGSVQYTEYRKLGYEPFGYTTYDDLK